MDSKRVKVEDEELGDLSEYSADEIESLVGGADDVTQPLQQSQTSQTLLSSSPLAGSKRAATDDEQLLSPPRVVAVKKEDEDAISPSSSSSSPKTLSQALRRLPKNDISTQDDYAAVKSRQAPQTLVEYATRKYMGKSSRTPAGAVWLWEFCARFDVADDLTFHMTGDKYQRAFDYNTGKWSGVRNPCDFMEMSLADKDEALAHKTRLETAAQHYKEKGKSCAFNGTTFEGKFYRGMPIGCSHQWDYEDAKFGDGIVAQQVKWKETKVHVDRWYLDVKGKLVNGGSGDTIAPGSYVLLGNQVATRLDEAKNAYHVALRGVLHYLGPAFDKSLRDTVVRLQLAAFKKSKVAASGKGGKQAAAPAGCSTIDKFFKRA